MKNKLLRRPFNYLLLAVLIILVQVLLTIVLVIATGDQIEGMKLSAIPGVIAPQFLFGLIFIKHKIIVRLMLSAVMTACIFGFLLLLIQMDFIKTNLDIYGIWD